MRQLLHWQYQHSAAQEPRPLLKLRLIMPWWFLAQPSVSEWHSMWWLVRCSRSMWFCVSLLAELLLKHSFAQGRNALCFPSHQQGDRSDPPVTLWQAWMKDFRNTTFTKKPTILWAACVLHQTYTQVTPWLQEQRHLQFPLLADAAQVEELLAHHLLPTHLVHGVEAEADSMAAQLLWLQLAEGDFVLEDGDGSFLHTRLPPLFLARHQNRVHLPGAHTAAVLVWDVPGLQDCGYQLLTWGFIGEDDIQVTTFADGLMGTVMSWSTVHSIVLLQTEGTSNTSTAAQMPLIPTPFKKKLFSSLVPASIGICCVKYGSHCFWKGQW